MRLSRIVQQMVCHEITPDATLGRSALDLLDLAVLLNIRRRGYEERFFFEYMERCSQDVAPSPRLSGNREHFLLGRAKTIPTLHSKIKKSRTVARLSLIDRRTILCSRSSAEQV
jgi:hypothetical protein